MANDELLFLVRMSQIIGRLFKKLFEDKEIWKGSDV